MIKINKNSIEENKDFWDRILKPLSHNNRDFYLHYWVDKSGNIKECLASTQYTEDLIISYENDQILNSDQWEIV